MVKSHNLGGLFEYRIFWTVVKGGGGCYLAVKVGKGRGESRLFFGVHSTFFIFFGQSVFECTVSIRRSVQMSVLLGSYTPVSVPYSPFRLTNMKVSTPTNMKVDYTHQHDP